MKEKEQITVKGIFLKLFDAIIGIFVGIFKGVKYLMIALPFIVVAFVVLLIFFSEPTIAAIETIKKFIIP